MTQRKFFTLEPDEEFLGVIRPSLWTLGPRILTWMMLLVFPFAVWQSFLSLGVLGVVLGGTSCIVGALGMRDIRRHYLENGIYLTSLRAIDVHASRRAFRVAELRWQRVHQVQTERAGVWSWFGYGAFWIHGVPDEAFSLVVQPLWRAHLVTDMVRKVHSGI